MNQSGSRSNRLNKLGWYPVPELPPELGKMARLWTPWLLGESLGNGFPVAGVVMSCWWPWLLLYSRGVMMVAKRVKAAT